MLIDFIQNQNSVEFSYVNNKGYIEVEELFMEPNSPNGFYQIMETTEDDPDKLQNLSSFRGSPLKKEIAKSFRKLNQNEFINVTLKELNPELYEKINWLREPKIYSIDIETQITDEYGYSDEDHADNEIISISITNENLNTILFIVKNPKEPLKELPIKSKNYIESLLEAQLGKYYNMAGPNQNQPCAFSIQEFDTEADMLVAFVAAVQKYFHMIIGWNIFGYDLKYIFKRCDKLGIDYKKMSPVNALAPEKKSINLALEVPLKYPRHRLAADYMRIFKASETFRNLDSYSLDNVSHVVLELGKVTYEGNLRKLYEDDYLKFVAYALVDTILVMLLHLQTNLLSTYFFQSYYNSLPYMRLNQNPISEALIYRELRRKNLFIVESEYPKKVYNSYPGGFVKLPTVHEVLAAMGIDFNSLYPNAMISCYLSFDNKFDDTIKMDEFGKPINEFNRAKFEKYKSMGYCITPMGRIYKADENNIYTQIEKNLLAERKIYKKAKEDIYMNIIPSIEAEIERRKSLKV